MQITFSEHLKGRTVLDGTGNVVGSLDEILINGVDWQIEGFRVKLTRDAGKDIGAAGGIFHAATVDIPRSMVKAAGDAVILSASRATLQDLVSAADATRRERAADPPADVPHR
jgi:sporulation protein YlmC with PRC-barrel domain